MSRLLAALARLGRTFGFGSCAAAEYTFALPEVLGSPGGELNLAVNLGGEFASISGARLRIADGHSPGLLGELNSSDTHPYPAAIDAYSPAEPFGHSGILGELMPSVAVTLTPTRHFNVLVPAVRWRMCDRRSRAV